MDKERSSIINSAGLAAIQGEMGSSKSHASSPSLRTHLSLHAFVPRVETFRWVGGLYFLILGMSFLLLPQGKVGIWLQPTWLVGGWMLLTGMGLLWLNVLTLPRRLALVFSIVLAIPNLIVSIVYLLSGATTPAITLFLFVLGILLSPLAPPGRIDEDTRPDALGLIVGTIALVQGLNFLLSSATAAIILSVHASPDIVALIFVVSGCAVIITQLIPRTPDVLRWLAHLACGLVVIGLQAAIAVFIDPVFWVLGAATLLRGFATILLPWWSNRAARFDRNAFRPRVALALITASLVPVMIALPVVLGTFLETSAAFTMAREVAFGTALLMMILSGIGGWLLAGTLTSPLTSLIHGVDRITQGRHTIPLPRQGTSEMVHLSQAVEQMAQVLDERAREQTVLMEQLKEQNEALGQAHQQMDALLGIVSHEIKTPITVVKGYLQLAVKQLERLHPQQPAPSEESTAIITSIQETLYRVQRQLGVQTRLANDLVDISRIQNNRLELQVELCNLVQSVQEAVEDQLAFAPARQISLHSTLQEVLVLADSGRVGQVTSNFLTNALKYSEANKPVEVYVSQEGAIARVAVRDHGPGITAEQQQHIWERFYRVPGITVKSGSGVGLGLGLHICKQLIERQGGQVGIESTPGQGSTFWFTLPRVQA